MSTLVVRLPESLHKNLQSLAEREGVSIDQFVSTSVAEKMSALMTNDRYPRSVAAVERMAVRGVTAQRLRSSPLF